LRRVGVFPVEFLHLGLCVTEVTCRFPSVVAVAIPFPVNKVLELSAVKARVQDFIYFVFFLRLDDNRERLRVNSAGDWIRWCGLEEGDVEDRVDTSYGGG
jgi:hypothetical protein